MKLLTVYSPSTQGHNISLTVKLLTVYSPSCLDLTKLAGLKQAALMWLSMMVLREGSREGVLLRMWTWVPISEHMPRSSSSMHDIATVA